MGATKVSSSRRKHWNACHAVQHPWSTKCCETQPRDCLASFMSLWNPLWQPLLRRPHASLHSVFAHHVTWVHRLRRRCELRSSWRQPQPMLPYLRRYQHGLTLFIFETDKLEQLQIYLRVRLGVVSQHAIRLRLAWVRASPIFNFSFFEVYSVSLGLRNEPPDF